MTHQERVLRRRIVADKAREGTPIGDLARHFEVSRTYVINALKEFYPDAKQKSGSPRGSKTIRIISELIRTTDSYRVIADRVGVKSQRVAEIASELRSEKIQLPER